VEASSGSNSVLICLFLTLFGVASHRAKAFEINCKRIAEVCKAVILSTEHVSVFHPTMKDSYRFTGLNLLEVVLHKLSDINEIREFDFLLCAKKMYEFVRSSVSHRNRQILGQICSAPPASRNTVSQGRGFALEFFPYS